MKIIKAIREHCLPLPTIFDLPEIWQVNTKEHGIVFNLVSLPFYPLLAIGLLVFTVAAFFSLLINGWRMK